MKTLKLRNHIPIAAPARREPVDGTESRLRVSLGFEPAWFTRRCPVVFTERWHRDPFYRYETIASMKAELHRAFPAVPEWNPRQAEGLATISGVYGGYVVPHAFGVPLRYGHDRWPMLEPGYRLSVEQIERLEPQTALESPAVEDVFRQMEIIEREWGRINGYLNWQGVLNNAFHLRGQEIFLDIHDRPELVRRFFGVIAEAMIRLARAVQERQRRSSFPIDQLAVSNCVMNMISPEQYEEFVLPHDCRIARSFERFGVHTCNWNVTPYLGVLRRLPKLGYLDMGMMSDMAGARDAFPDTYRAVLYSPVKLQDGSVGEIRRDVERIYRELSPCDVVMADIQATTPDERVRTLLDICRSVAAGGSADG